MNMKNQQMVHSLGHAVLVSLYVWCVASIMSHAEQIFGETSKILSAVAFLLMFVISATIVGALVLGRPVILFLNGQKREALNFFISTLGWLILLTAFVFGSLIAFR